MLVPRAPRLYHYMDLQKLPAEAEPWPELHIPEGCGENPGEFDENSGERRESNGCSDEFEGLKYAEIVRECFNQQSGEPGVSERNAKFHQPACNLRGIISDPRLLDLANTLIEHCNTQTVHVYQANNLQDLLPEVFNRGQAIAIRKLRGKSEDPSNMLYMWKQRNHIIQIDEDTYQKV